MTPIEVAQLLIIALAGLSIAAGLLLIYWANRYERTVRNLDWALEVLDEASDRINDLNGEIEELKLKNADLRNQIFLKEKAND